MFSSLKQEARASANLQGIPLTIGKPYIWNESFSVCFWSPDARKSLSLFMINAKLPAARKYFFILNIHCKTVYVLCVSRYGGLTYQCVPRLLVRYVRLSNCKQEQFGLKVNSTVARRRWTSRDECKSSSNLTLRSRLIATLTALLAEQ